MTSQHVILIDFISWCGSSKKKILPFCENFHFLTTDVIGAETVGYAGGYSARAHLGPPSVHLGPPSRPPRASIAHLGPPSILANWEK